MKCVIGKTFRSGDAEMLDCRKTLRSVEQSWKRDVLEISRIGVRCLKIGFWTAAPTLDLQKRIGNSVRKKLSRVSGFSISIRKPALKFARPQQSANQPLTRVVAAKQPQLFDQGRLERIPADTPPVPAKDQQIQTAHRALVRLLSWPF